MQPTLPCHGCGRAVPTRFIQLRQMVGLLVAAVSRIHGGVYCGACERRLYRRTAAVNLTAGLCCLFSPFAIPMIVAQNWIQHRRFGRQLAESTATGAAAAAVRSLPWEPLIGAEPISMDGVQITWPIAAVGAGMIAIGLGVYMSVFAAVWVANGPMRGPAQDAATPAEMAADAHEPRRLLGTSLAVAGGGAAVFLAGLRWQLARERRPDAAPDVLAGVLPTSALFQVRRLHFAVLGRQVGACYRVVVCAQNLFDTPTVLNVALDGVRTTPAIATGSLATEVPAAGVVVASADCPLPALAGPTELTLSLRLACRGERGRRVRRANRAAVSSKGRDDAFALAQVLGGGGGTVRLSRPQPTAGVSFLGGQGRLSGVVLPFGAGPQPARRPRGVWRTSGTPPDRHRRAGPPRPWPPSSARSGPGRCRSSMT